MSSSFSHFLVPRSSSSLAEAIDEGSIAAAATAGAGRNSHSCQWWIGSFKGRLDDSWAWVVPALFFKGVYIGRMQPLPLIQFPLHAGARWQDPRSS